jgi:hypothetical protein
MLMEGQFGAQNMRFCDVIGDTVPTDERIEKYVGAREIWISEDTRLSLANKVQATKVYDRKRQTH